MKNLLLGLLLSTQLFAQTPLPRVWHLYPGSGISKTVPHSHAGLATATSWYIYKQKADGTYDLSQVDEARLTRTANEWDNRKIMVLDIEQFGVDAVGRYQMHKAIDTIKKHNPSVVAGFYGYLPHRSWWDTVLHLKNIESMSAGGPATFLPYDTYLQRYVKIMEMNKPFLEKETYSEHSLSQKIDAVFPSCYTFYRDQVKYPILNNDPDVDRWKHYCLDQIKEARKYNKRVIVYLWPYFHSTFSTTPTTNPKGYMKGDFWRYQLEFAHKHADGVVLWHGGINKTTAVNEEWWAETVKFLQEKGLPVLLP